jgi:hypothetical protein
MTLELFTLQSVFVFYIKFIIGYFQRSAVDVKFIVYRIVTYHNEALVPVFDSILTVRDSAYFWLIIHPVVYYISCTLSYRIQKTLDQLKFE